MRFSMLARNPTGTGSISSPRRRAVEVRVLLSLPVGSDELIPNRPENLLIGERGELHQMLSIFESVEDDHESIDPKRHRPPEKLIFGREVVFAEVGAGVEETAVLHEQLTVGIENLRCCCLVGGRDDETFDDVASDVERRLK